MSKKLSDEEEFEDKIIEDIIKNEPNEHKRIKTPTVKDAVKIKDEIKTEIDDFLKTASEFNKVNAAATRQEKVGFYNKLLDDVQDISDSRLNMKTHLLITIYFVIQMQKIFVTWSTI